MSRGFLRGAYQAPKNFAKPLVLCRSRSSVTDKTVLFLFFVQALDDEFLHESLVADMALRCKHPCSLQGMLIEATRDRLVRGRTGGRIPSWIRSICASRASENLCVDQNAASSSSDENEGTLSRLLTVITAFSTCGLSAESLQIISTSPCQRIRHAPNLTHRALQLQHHHGAGHRRHG